MKKPFRMALVGAGEVTRQSHLPAVLASPLVRLTALVDPATDRAARLARAYGCAPRITNSIEAVFGEVDGAVIATPNHSHAPIALACIRAGVPCLIEKPMCTSLADAEAICEAAERAGVVVGVGYSTRFRTVIEVLKEQLDAGMFGAIRRFHYQEGTIGGWSPVSNYILDSKASGGGVLTVVGTHFLDRMLYWFGYPDEVEMADDAEGGVEAHCIATVRYHSRGRSFEGTILLSKLVKIDPGLVIQTDRGLVSLALGSGSLVWRPTDAPAAQMVMQSRGGPLWDSAKSQFQRQIEDFVMACRGRWPPMVPARHGLESVRLLGALYASRMTAVGRRRELADAAE